MHSQEGIRSERSQYFRNAGRWGYAYDATL